MKKAFILSALILSLCLAEAVTLPAYASKTDDCGCAAVKSDPVTGAVFCENSVVESQDLEYFAQTTTKPPASILSYEAEVVRLVNVQRSRRGLQTLKSNWSISRVARYKSQDMINRRYFSHISPTYGSPFKMMESFGIRFSAAGENIAYGQKTPAAVMNAWMNSPGHRANILSASYTNIGVGLAKNKNGVCYWTQMFTKPLK